MSDDILKDPTANLMLLLSRTSPVDPIHELHRHILAGGPLPEQWQKGAVGVLLADAESNARLLEGYAEHPQLAGLKAMADITRAAMRAVTGEK